MFQQIDIQFEPMFRDSSTKDFKAIIKNGIVDVKQIRFISSKKFKKGMIESLQKLKNIYPNADYLIHDLNIFVNRIHQEDLVKTVIEIKPFRPCFQSLPLLRTTIQSSQSSRTKILQSKTSKQKVVQYFKQQTLNDQFSKPYHPFSLIIKGFLLIQQQKYANLCQKKSIQEIKNMLIQDLSILCKFLQMSSEIYILFFKADNQKQKIVFTKHLYRIVKEHVQSHQMINRFLIKAMRLSHKLHLKQLLDKIPQIAQLQAFRIPQEFKIGGCYIRAMNQLMIFSETPTASQSLQKLVDFRQAITQDIDAYYKQLNSDDYRQITAESQIQIIRYVLCKLKNWIPEISAQIKFLEIIYGQKEMGCNFDDASYMHCQISLSLETLEQ